MSSRFITESEALEARKKRQEEWDKVRTADDPEEVPELAHDPRSLYERLQEQKQKRDLEYEEAHKLKNMIKGLDDDEVEFLDYVDRTKLAADRKKNLEEEKELHDYRNRVANLQEKSQTKKLQAETTVSKPKSVGNPRSSQTKLLKGAVVVRNEPKKRKVSERGDNMDDNHERKRPNVNANPSEPNKNVGDNETVVIGEDGSTSQAAKDESLQNRLNGGLMCIGILPGLGCYDESSSDECSSDSEQENQVSSAIGVDLLGRKIVKIEKETLYKRRLKRDAHKQAS